MKNGSPPAPPDRAPPALGPMPDDPLLQKWLRAYLRHAPLSLVVRELNRLIAIHAIEGGDDTAGGAVLDVGCGDGFWWKVRGLGGRRVVGVDIDPREVAAASAHIDARVADVADAPPGGGPFGQIIGNCSLEHVRAIDRALTNLHACAAPGARLVLFVPTPQWAYQGMAQGMLLRRAPRVAMALAGALNGFFQHWHLHELAVWKQILAENGWAVRATWGIGSARSEFVFRLFLAPALASFWLKQLVGRYPERALSAAPDVALSPAERIARWALADPIGPSDSPHAYEYAIVATRIEASDD